MYKQWQGQGTDKHAAGSGQRAVDSGQWKEERGETETETVRERDERDRHRHRHRHTYMHM
jgi:hypothetical protein